MSAASVRAVWPSPPSFNALDHQSAFIGPKWDLLKRFRYLRETELIYCRMVADAILEHGKDDVMIPMYLKRIVELRELLARLDAYQQASSENLRRWRDAADAAGADLNTFTGPVPPAAEVAA